MTRTVSTAFFCRLRARLAALFAMVCWVAIAGLANPAQAHEMSIAELTLREAGSGEFVWSWGLPAKGRPVAEDLKITWPDGCQPVVQAVRCGPKGLVGRLEVDGLGRAYSAALLRIRWRGGEDQVITLSANQTSVQLFGGAKDERGLGEIARTYVWLGVEHILAGYDHLLFVLGLLMLVGFRRRLIGTITAFTAAHTLTLLASAMGWLVLRPPPVEAVIALSIMLVSAEALHQRQTLSRQWPALVAFLFGLVHGLGFAGALKEIGLPQQHVLTALLSFNVGVELGQLFVVALAWGLAVLAMRWPQAARLRAPLLYGAGSIAAYWTITRVAAIVA